MMFRRGTSPSPRLPELFLIALMLFVLRTAPAQAQDCNNNGIDDATDIAKGTSTDCQPDGIPDECGLLVTCEDLRGQRLVPAGAKRPDAVGESVDIDGDRIIVGAWGTPCPTGPECGAAYIFRNQEGIWIEETALRPPDSLMNQPSRGEFGLAVLLQDDLAVVSAPNEYRGAVYMFRFDG